MRQHTHTLKTPLSNHGSHAHRRTTISYLFLETSISIWIRNFRPNSTEKSDLTINEEVMTFDYRPLPHVWSNQYWGTPNGVPQQHCGRRWMFARGLWRFCLMWVLFAGLGSIHFFQFSSNSSWIQDFSIQFNSNSNRIQNLSIQFQFNSLIFFQFKFNSNFMHCNKQINQVIGYFKTILNISLFAARLRKYIIQEYNNSRIN